MFPRIKTTAGKKRTYQYLVISQSVRDAKGRSTTKDIATLGNAERFSKETISSVVDGLIRLFKLDEYGGLPAPACRCASRGEGGGKE